MIINRESGYCWRALSQAAYISKNRDNLGMIVQTRQFWALGMGTASSAACRTFPRGALLRFRAAGVGEEEGVSGRGYA